VVPTTTKTTTKKAARKTTIEKDEQYLLNRIKEGAAETLEA
jgi:hypothetical protein